MITSVCHVELGTILKNVVGKMIDILVVVYQISCLISQLQLMADTRHSFSCTLLNSFQEIHVLGKIGVPQL